MADNNLNTQQDDQEESLLDRIKKGYKKMAPSFMGGDSEEEQQVNPDQPKTLVDTVKQPPQPDLTPTPDQQAAAGQPTVQQSYDTSKVGAPMPKKPEDIADLTKRLEQYKDTLPDDVQKQFEDKLNDINQKRQEAEQIYREGVRTTQWSQVAERIGQALAQLGAAMHGMKTGVDMSNLKFDKTDWNTNYENLRKDLGIRLEDLRDQRALTFKQQAEQVAAAKPVKHDVREALMRDYFARSKAYNDAVKEANKAPKPDKAAEALKGQLTKDLEARNRIDVNLQQIDSGNLSTKQKKAAADSIKKDMIGLRTGSDTINNLFEPKGGFMGFFKDTDYKQIKDYNAAQKMMIQKQLNGLGGNASKPAPQGPQPGDVQDGYKFKGGDPADKNNWEPAAQEAEE
jgi:hypothetical protein